MLSLDGVPYVVMKSLMSNEERTEGRYHIDRYLIKCRHHGFQRLLDELYRPHYRVVWNMMKASQISKSISPKGPKSNDSKYNTYLLGITRTIALFGTKEVFDR
ncbi:hypothetical protein DICVIV_12622 [Dictyocaulus viviparus]|uniref:Uncharacterized protein n=1 Tax=Dictyocaulus viviparus TaxID=29172 RepID=A0A0D8X9Y9_DICVI|nr:hypothetical protein DICVIV_12622 [Dictyocaulus viviparus]